MDYLQIYNEQFNSTWKEEKDQTIKAFKLAKENNKNFNTVFNKINASQYQKQKKMVADFNERNQLSCYDLFEKRYQEYDNELPRDEIISLALKNEVKNEFVVLGNKEYDLFIRKLAKQQSVFEIQNHFSNYRDYYELIYKQGKYEYFHAKNFENYNYDTSKEYIEMAEITDAKNPIVPSTLITKTTENKTVENYNSEDQRTIAKIENFSNKEKHLLLIVLFHSIGSNNQNSNNVSEKVYQDLPLSEYLRILAITKDLINYEPFYKDLSVVSLYQQLKKKYDLIKKNESDLFLSDLRQKLNDLRIKEFQKYLFEFLKKN